MKRVISTRPSNETISRSCSPGVGPGRADIVLAARAALEAQFLRGGLVGQMHDHAAGGAGADHVGLLALRRAPRLRCGRGRWDSGTRRGPSGRRSRRRGWSPAFRARRRARPRAPNWTTATAGSCCCTPASKIVSADAIARLATVRALRDLIIAFPRAIPWPLPSSSQAQNSCRSNDVHQITPRLRFGFRGSILYWPHQGLNPLVCLTGSAPSHIPRLHV